MKKILIVALAALIWGCYGTQDRHGDPALASYELMDEARGLDSATDGVDIGLVWMAIAEDSRLSHFAIFSQSGNLMEGPYQLLSRVDPRPFSRYPRVFWDGSSYLIIWSEDSPEGRTLFMKRHHPGESWSIDDVQVMDVGEHFIQTSSVYLFESEIVVTWRDSRVSEASPMAYGAIYDHEGNRVSEDIFLGEDSSRSFETRAAKYGSTIAFVVAILEEDDSPKMAFRSYDTVSQELSALNTLVDSLPATPREIWVEGGLFRLIYNSNSDADIREAHELKLDLEGNILQGPMAFGHNSLRVSAISVAFEEDVTVLCWVEQESETPGTLYLMRADEEISVLDWNSFIHETTLVTTESRFISIWSDDQPFLNFLSIPR